MSLTQRVKTFGVFVQNYSEYVFHFLFFQICKRVFECTKSKSTTDLLQPDAAVSLEDLGNQSLLGKDSKIKSIPFELYKRRTSVFVRRETFLDIVCDALAEYKYLGPNQRADLVLACR